MKDTSNTTQVAAYPHKAVESVDGREFKVQAEEVKREDAENIHLRTVLGADVSHCRVLNQTLTKTVKILC